MDDAAEAAALWIAQELDAAKREHWCALDFMPILNVALHILTPAPLLKWLAMIAISAAAAVPLTAFHTYLIKTIWKSIFQP
jgi:hypothetical protein